MASLIAPERVKARRKALGLTQNDIAKALGVSQALVGQIENGDTNTTSKIYKLAQKLETTVEYLTSETDDSSLPKPTANEISTQLDAVQIAQIDLQYGMGGGAYFDLEIETKQMLFSRNWISQFTNSPPDKLFWAFGVGDSMQPTINSGEIVLIDTTQKDPKAMADRIFALTHYESGMIKRIRQNATGYDILSDNASVRPLSAHDGEMAIIGRVVAVLKRV